MNHREREGDGSRFSKAIKREIVRKEVWMLRHFGACLEANLDVGDCPVPEGSELISIRQELLRFSIN